LDKPASGAGRLRSMTIYYPIVAAFALVVLIAVLALWGPRRLQHRFEYLTFALLISVSGLSLTTMLLGRSRDVIFVSGVILAISLFLWRIRHRSYYGMAEIAFGLYVLWDASVKGLGGFNADFDPHAFATFQLSVIFIQTFGAIYVMIRGMDNCLQGLPEPTRKSIEERVRVWKIVF
jgi:hypothetical protein